MLTSLGFLIAVLVAVCLIGKPLRSSSSFSELLNFPDLWRWHGTVDRGRYAAVGFVGFAIKHNIDRFVATFIFGRSFTPFNYWIPPVDAVRPSSLSSADARFLATMVVIALPFIWVGLAMTIRRLRSAGLPLWLVILFFVPIGNLPFFIALAFIPARRDAMTTGPTSSAIGSFIPRDKLGSAAMAVVITGVAGAAATYIGVEKIGTYGWGVFVALPFCLGLFSVLIYSYHQRQPLRSCLIVSLMSVGIVAVALFAFAIEGLICIAMALPIALPLALLGGGVGFLVQRQQSRSGEAPSMMAMMLVLPFVVMTTETLGVPEAQRVNVQTKIQINARPETIWKYLVAFPDVSQEPSTVFQLGVSYPIRADIHEEGVGGLRECLFSTGTYMEKIDVWEEGKRFGFKVLSGPEGMRELSPYDIHPPHLHGYFVPESAEFRLIPNADGTTSLEGTSWYRNSMWPAAYWRLWSDAVLHEVHMRVFEHVKTLAETRR